jgi:phosphatidate phosphatase APP1
VPNPLLSALSTVERAVDHSIARVRRRFGLWDDVHVVPYHGLGRPDRVRLLGRVLDDEEVDHEGALTRWENVRLTARRYISDEVPGARLAVTVGGRTVEVTADEDGFYEVDAAVDLPDGPLWREATVRLLEPTEADRPAPEVAHRFQVPPHEARFVLISDLDDTVVRTGATDKLRFARVVLLNNATTREVFPGVGAFYRALGEEGGAPTNPVVYLSSSPWNLYRQFVGALDHRDVPPGAVYLKNFGIEPDVFIKSGHHGHKLGRIRETLNFYPHLPAVLVGDSGQEDAEIYQQVVARYPGRVRAVFIRDVSDDGRDRIVDRIARDVEARGVPMRRVGSTVEAAEAAADLGLVDARAVERVREASAREGGGVDGSQ